MLMTRKQAREMWCPMVRYANGHEATNCAVNTERLEAECRGDLCAMWRWGEAPKMLRTFTCHDPAATTEPSVRPAGLPADWRFSPYDEAGEPAAWVEPMDQAQSRRRGYCGLAGKPVEE